jgi:hypothetical protein
MNTAFRQKQVESLRRNAGGLLYPNQKQGQKETESVMRGFGTFCWVVLGVLLALWLWSWGTSHVVSAHFLETHLLDVVMGVLCFLWLLIILKAPWDLYFKAREVQFEQTRAMERKIELGAGRTVYVQQLQPKLLQLAIGTHLFSAALVAAITSATQGKVGYYFAVFYLVSTVFRPLLAGYGYLMQRLRTMQSEAYFPRFDSTELELKLRAMEETYRQQEERYNQMHADLYQEISDREQETARLRQSITNIGNEFEATLSRTSSNEEVLRGLNALVAFIRQAAPR